MDDWETIHINLHALRMIKGYKPSEFEIRVGRIVAERFKNSCSECKAALEQQSNPQNQNSEKKDLFGGLGGFLYG